MEPAELIRRAEARCQEAFRRMEEIEYHNTEKVLDVMRRHNCKNFVFSSTPPAGPTTRWRRLSAFGATEPVP